MKRLNKIKIKNKKIAKRELNSIYSKKPKNMNKEKENCNYLN